MDAVHGGGGELDATAGRLDSRGLALMGSGPALVDGDEITLGEDQLRLHPQVGKGGEEVAQRRPPAAASTRFAVGDEVIAQKPVDGIRGRGRS